MSLMRPSYGRERNVSILRYGVDVGAGEVPPPEPPLRRRLRLRGAPLSPDAVAWEAPEVVVVVGWPLEPEPEERPELPEPERPDPPEPEPPEPL